MFEADHSKKRTVETGLKRRPDIILSKEGSDFEKKLLVFLVLQNIRTLLLFSRSLKHLPETSNVCLHGHVM